jgi:hypothetical protein
MPIAAIPAIPNQLNEIRLINQTAHYAKWTLAFDTAFDSKVHTDGMRGIIVMWTLLATIVRRYQNG